MGRPGCAAEVKEGSCGWRRKSCRRVWLDVGRYGEHGDRVGEAGQQEKKGTGQSVCVKPEASGLVLPGCWLLLGCKAGPAWGLK